MLCKIAAAAAADSEVATAHFVWRVDAGWLNVLAKELMYLHVTMTKPTNQSRMCRKKKKVVNHFPDHNHEQGKWKI